jgi:hypothetical protein
MMVPAAAFTWIKNVSSYGCRCSPGPPPLGTRLTKKETLAPCAMTFEPRRPAGARAELLDADHPNHVGAATRRLVNTTSRIRASTARGVASE